MTTQNYEHPDLGTIVRIVLLSSVVMVLPAVAWSSFGWLHMALPLLAFYVLSKFGDYTGKRFLITSTAVAAIVFLLLRSIDLFIFSSIFLIAGYIFFRSIEQKDSPVVSGFKTSGTIALGWLLIVVFLSIGSDTSPYTQLIETLDKSINEILTYYRQSDEVSADTMLMLESTLYRMKVIMPIIMPSILGSIILFVTWFTMVMGNNLLVRLQGESPWPSYGSWQLPEKMIWIVILCGVSTATQLDLLSAVGINGLILISIIYCFQGLAITVFFMDKWNIPILLRSFIYVIMILQSVGLILLLIFGIADIWFDFRKLKPKIVDDQD